MATGLSVFRASNDNQRRTEIRFHREGAKTAKELLRELCALA